jgi:hypothetical protein
LCARKEENCSIHRVADIDRGVMKGVGALMIRALAG